MHICLHYLSATVSLGHGSSQKFSQPAKLETMAQPTCPEIPLATKRVGLLFDPNKLLMKERLRIHNYISLRIYNYQEGLDIYASMSLGTGTYSVPVKSNLTFLSHEATL